MSTLSQETSTTFLDQRTTRALRVIAIRLFGSLILIYFVLSRYSPTTWQGVIIFSAVILLGLANLTGMLLIRARRIDLGIAISAIALQLTLMALGVLLQSLGILILSASLTLTLLAIANTVPARLGRQLMLSSAATGATALLVDVIAKSAPFRLALEDVQTVQIFGWGLVAAILVINTRHLFQQFNLANLQTKLVAAFSIVTLASVVILAFLNTRSTAVALTAEANEALFAAASQTKDSIEDFLNANLAAIRTEAQLPAFTNFLIVPAGLRNTSVEGGVARDTLQTLLTKDEENITSYAILDTTGRNVLDTARGDIGSNKSDRVYFQEAIQSGEAYVSEVLFSPSTGEPSLYFSAPIKGTSGQILGVVRVRYDAIILQNLVQRSNDLVGEDSFGVLFDDHFIHLAHGTAPETLFTTVMPLEATLFESLKNDLRLPERPEEEIFLDLPELEMHLERAAVSGSGTEFFAAEDIATGDRLNQAVVVSIENPRWFLVFFQPQDIFLAPVVAQTNSSLLISLLIGVVVVGLAIVLAQFLTAPINRLTTVANQISGGDLNARAEVEVEDEVGVLAKTFNAMTAQLQALIVNLEDQVAERTKELEKRAGRLKAAAETARDATAETDLRESFNRAVTLTRSRFDLYHVALYLIDDRGEYAVLQAATEAAGERLLASEHRIQVGSNNAVGIACLYGEAHIVGDSPEIGLFEHPLLPLAKSEMALPLKVGEEILGAMDLFSDQENAFTLEDATLLQTMADQIAVATQKTKLRGEVELALEELQAAYGEYTREAWQSLPLKRKRQLGYRYNQLKIEAATDQSPETERVWQQNERVIVEGLTTSLNGEPTSVLAVPVRFRGQAIGVLNLEFDGETVPAEAKELVEEIGERLGLILENVRLLEETQRRVSQERLVNDLSERVRSVLDINTILKTAAQEVQQTIGLPEVTIRLAPPAEFSGNGKQADASENGDVESSETRNE